MKTYKDGLYEINEQITVIDNNLYQNELAIQNAQGENLSVEVYKRIIDEMIDNIDDMTDADKKMLMNLLIEKIEIYPEKQPDGRWIKSVQFKIPLNIDGKAVDTLYFDDDEHSYNLKGIYNVKKMDGSLDERYPHFSIGDEVKVLYAKKKVLGIELLDVRLDRSQYDYPKK